MHRRTARGNRLGLALTGLVLLVAGAALFAANRGYFSKAAERDALYPASARRFVHDNGSWLWPVVAAVAIVVGLLFLRWLLVQPRTDRLGRLRIDTDAPARPGEQAEPGAGRTRMPATALADVVEDDIAALRGVRRVSAAVSGHTDAPALWLRVTADADADVAAIRAGITGSVLPDVRACLERPDLPTFLRLTVSRRAGARSVH